MVYGSFWCFIALTGRDSSCGDEREGCPVLSFDRGSCINHGKHQRFIKCLSVNLNDKLLSFNQYIYMRRTHIEDRRVFDVCDIMCVYLAARGKEGLR